MPKITKKRNVNWNEVSLSTGIFTYQGLRDTSCAHILEIQPSTSFKKERLKIFPILLKQTEIILRKEGYTSLIHMGHYDKDFLKLYETNNWTTIFRTSTDWTQDTAYYGLFKDQSKEKSSNIPLRTLLENDQQEKIGQIISESSSTKTEEIIDQELEPQGNVNNRGILNLLENLEQIERDAPAEPRAAPQPNAPLDGNFINNILAGNRQPARWIIDDAGWPGADAAFGIQPRQGMDRVAQQINQRPRRPEAQPEVFPPEFFAELDGPPIDPDEAPRF